MGWDAIVVFFFTGVALFRYQKGYMERRYHVLTSVCLEVGRIFLLLHNVLLLPPFHIPQ